MEHAVDAGTGFGQWDDDVSRFMYHSITPLVVDMVLDRVPGNDDVTLGDYGGANGLLRQYTPEHVVVTTIDHDPTKDPDICDDVLLHNRQYDIGFSRYVLHYLDDAQVRQFADNMRAHCTSTVFVVQFANEGHDLTIKRANSERSPEGTKYFRTAAQLCELLQPVWDQPVLMLTYDVTSEFYANRLGIEEADPHQEQMLVFCLK